MDSFICSCVRHLVRLGGEGGADGCPAVVSRRVVLLRWHVTLVHLRHEQQRRSSSNDSCCCHPTQFTAAAAAAAARAAPAAA